MRRQCGYTIVGLVTAVGLNLSAIAQPGNSDMSAVEAANKAFYTALSSRDMNSLQKVWASHDANIQNVGPSYTVPDIGWEAVKKGYAATFDMFQSMKVTMADAHVRVNGPVAEVVGSEHTELKQKDGTTISPVNLGSSVFEKQTDGTWLMVAHHASRMPSR
jgi:ketosteroid isomerase-like protein